MIYDSEVCNIGRYLLCSNCTKYQPTTETDEFDIHYQIKKISHLNISSSILSVCPSLL